MIAVVWALFIAIYLLFFATMTIRGVTSSGAPGQPEITTEFVRRQRWIDAVEPFTIGFVLALSAIISAGAVAAWRGAVLPAALLTLAGFTATYVSGFSIGPLYLPGTVALAVCLLLVSIDRLMARHR
jgi:hypothetical protein